MPLVRRLSLLMAALCAGGCASTQALLPAPPAPPVLPTQPRTLAVPNVAPLADGSAHAPALPTEYLHLTAEQCRQAACQHAPGADAVLAAARNDDRPVICDTSANAEVAQARRVLARRLSQEVRNRSAGAALDLYYQLLEAELLTESLTATVVELDALVATAEGFRDRGFQDGTELAKLRRQQAAARADLLRVRLAVRKLNGELKPLIGLADHPGQLLPTDRVTVTRETLDPEAAVRHALGCRGELIGLRELDAALGPKTVAAVRQALLGLIPGAQVVAAASYSRPLGLAHFLPNTLTNDVTYYRDMLHKLLAQREATAAKEVRAAVDEWSIQQEIVAVAKDKATAERRRFAELTGRRQGGAAVEAEYHATRLEAMRSDAELIREAVKWKRADIGVRLTMGVLCGPVEVPPCP